ncbi:hypothetical protein O6H91_03G047700 [Diphasiastrum complanatum]|uniref:Uncharacterized protein n=2 Tax=Diphasiastrum complanatum TaxID=34168 RepID=A0ACC2E6A5_DIPCM|nr:hypothetical protein O6H91_03G047700 [Diphasiastrum complanatum]
MAADVESSDDLVAEWGVEDGMNAAAGEEGTAAFYEVSALQGSGRDDGEIQEKGKDRVEEGAEEVFIDATNAIQPEQENNEGTGIRAQSEAAEGYMSISGMDRGLEETGMEETSIRKGDIDQEIEAGANGKPILVEDSLQENKKLEEEEEEEEEEALSKTEKENDIEGKEDALAVEAGGSSKAAKKRKGAAGENGVGNGTSSTAKKPKKKNAWSRTSSRKGSKKHSNKAAQARNLENENSVYLCPTPPHMEKVEDGPSFPILLSKICKAERVELSTDRLSAGSTKGYRMVRATRGVVEGAWYFEIRVEKLGPTGHTRLGWCTQKADIQAPVGYDTHGYSYRDLEGSKVHSALREPYGEAYSEGDVIGFYINLPNGAKLAPKPPEIVGYKGASYFIETKEEPPQPVPDSEICFFKNGICQGTAFKDIIAGRYYPAASMYTLPNEPNCTVRFNFGPEFSYPPPPIYLGDRPAPQPMSNAPFCDMNGQEVGAEATGVGASLKGEEIATHISSLDNNPQIAAGFTSGVSNGDTKGGTRSHRYGRPDETTSTDPSTS